MNLIQILNIIEIITGVALISVILMQQQGSGLGSMFGGSGGGEGYRSKRGAEAVLYNATVILLIIFVFVALGIAIVNANS